jgi:hypothetical protein
MRMKKMNKMTSIFLFAVGIGIGYSLGRRYALKTAEKNLNGDDIQEEISIDEVLKKYSGKMSENIEKENKEEPEATITEQKKDINSCNPYIITPEQFGEIEEYEKISLVYYSDGVLTDENNERVDDIEEIVREDSLNHFGEYEEDSVFVRNDSRKCDYEILMDLRKFEDVPKFMH